MIKTLAIFALQPFSWEVEQLRIEAEGRGLAVRVIDYFADRSFMKQPVPNYVIFRGVFDHTLHLDAHLEQSAIMQWLRGTDSVVLNQRALQMQPFTKKVQQDMAKQFGLPALVTYTYPSLVAMEKDQSWTVWPRVAKPNQGSLGLGVVKLAQIDDARVYFSTHEIGAYVFQELMEEGRDLRVIVVGGKLLGAMLRTAAPGVFVSNFSQGGSIAPYQVDQALHTIVDSIIQSFDLEYGGIDLIRDLSGRWRLLEINRAAQFRGFEQATGYNVAKALLAYIMSRDRSDV